MFSRRNIGSSMLCLTLSQPLLGCGAGPYGFSRTYANTSGELEAASDSQPYDPVMVERQFHKWADEKVSVFGVVRTQVPTENGSTELLLSIRTRQERNLCETTDEDSCRVTVSDHQFGTVHARVKLSRADASGKQSLGPGSLVRVVGIVAKEQHAQSGNPVIAARFYRHWPAGYYVTTKERVFMRR